MNVESAGDKLTLVKKYLFDISLKITAYRKELQYMVL